ncbi:hypothetical protein E2C01_063034 [Portunus trituberculatus]|uniref:Uncharacterized protein n=1 Tax=Portunus trituberculatus TaxID=210409 RepID=A0A5B7HJQ6_PORTR|nr:hypothetical protein [Portunus trituberculatus]
MLRLDGACFTAKDETQTRPPRGTGVTPDPESPLGERGMGSEHPRNLPQTSILAHEHSASEYQRSFSSRPACPGPALHHSLSLHSALLDFSHCVLSSSRDSSTCTGTYLVKILIEHAAKIHISSNASHTDSTAPPCGRRANDSAGVPLPRSSRAGKDATSRNIHPGTPPTGHSASSSCYTHPGMFILITSAQIRRHAAGFSGPRLERRTAYTSLEKARVETRTGRRDLS